MSSKVESKFSFQKPAFYEIRVEGVLSEKWTDKLQGLKISSQKFPDGNHVSTLKGQINDQSALSGILNTLYDLNMTILSVNTL